jgi:malonyl-CoA/methylmalonyl-CoA synthetase
MHLTQIFDLSLQGRAGSPALVYDDVSGVTRALTFGDVDARASRMANELAARGLAKGDRLCVHLANRVEYIDLFLACVRLGVILVPMNVLYRDRELRHIVGDAEPVAIVAVIPSEARELHVQTIPRGSSITDRHGHRPTGTEQREKPSFDKPARDAAPLIPIYPAGTPVWDVDDLSRCAAARDATRPIVSLDGDDPAIIIYTSGTTGAAKGAVLSHNNLAANGLTLTGVWRITERDRYLAVLPLFHVHGLGNGVHCWLISGCTMRLLERFDQRTAAETLMDFKPSLFFGVPTVYVRLLDPSVVSDEQAKAIGASARLFVSGSAPLPAHTHAAFRARYGHTILERYGMSEALMIMSNPYEGERRAGSVGPPLPGISARIVAEDGEILGDDQVGEIQIKSPHLISSYWRRPDATAAAFREGWFRTGDVAARSADGYYTLRGRRGDLIISGGFNIYPREIEELLLEDARVREAAVVGVPDDVRGEIPIAYIVADDALEARELESTCRAQLASFKIPRAFIRLETLPRTALGKIQRHLLPPWNGGRTT